MHTRSDGRRLGGLCAAVAIGALAASAGATTPQAPVTVTPGRGLGAVETRWDTDRGQFVPDLPEAADATVRDVFGERFAGLHYWRARGRRPVLVLHLVGATTADIPAVRRLLRDGPLSSVRTPVRIVPAILGEGELLRGVRALSRRLDADTVAAGIDTLRNQIVVTTAARLSARAAARGQNNATPSPAQRRLVRRLGLPEAAVRWTADDRPRPRALTTEMSGIFGGTRIWMPRPGTNVWTGCTAGFGFTNAWGRFMTTAGHCAPAGVPIHRSTPSGGIDTQISTMWTSAYNTTSGDIATYSVPFASARQYIGGDTLRYVQAASSPRVGEWVCFYGASTRQLSCGSISIINRTMTPDGHNGATIAHQFCTTGQRGGLDSGDSGAAIWVPYFQDDERKISIRGTLMGGSTGTICGTNAAVTLQQSAALPLTETPPCS